ncbi:MAG TPA: SDR family NAD(P)-dependent oxidoreductase [bacterium]|nr:SDR family NAD(P)-dependent oxidoreductase [bacterium]
MKPLADTIALVTGASRGVGRGIAHELGLAGATVYVTGRSLGEGPGTDGLPGTIDETARLVTEAGGRGFAVRCDHTDDAAVAALVSTLHMEAGRLDLLVNNAWGGYEQYDADLFALPPWEQPLWRWDKLFATGLRAHYVTTRAVLPLMLASPLKLIVEVSAGDEGKFLGDLQYDVVKAACDRLAFALSRRLRNEGFTALTLHPGFTRTERVEVVAPPEELVHTHSARFAGRGVVALATDPRRGERSGGAFKAGQLGLDYGFTDVDGSQPAPFVIPEQ